MEAFVSDAAGALAAQTTGGAEIPFEVIETEGRPGRAALYCYRPLTAAFIAERLGALSGLESYSPAARAVAAVERPQAYLIQRGMTRVPDEPRLMADAVLTALLQRVFEERSEFEFDP